MAKFKYVAVTPGGETVRGKVSALNAGSVRASLIEQGMEVAEIEEQKGLLQIELTKRKIPRDEMMHFSRQLAAFLRAGVPMLDALNVIQEEAGNPQLRRVLARISEDLKGGDSFADAIATQQQVFPRFYTSMVRSAELTGRLDLVLEQLSTYIERDLEARQKIRSALAYPAVILALSIVTVIILTGFVLPRFAKFFASLDVRLPLTTRMMLGLAAFVSNWWWAMLAAVVLISLTLYAVFRTPAGRAWRDKTLLKLPLVGQVARLAVVERFCRVLASMVRAGVPLPTAIEVVGDATNNAVYRERMASVRTAMMEGEGIARPIARTGVFPSALVQILRVGEETGTLDDQLETAARYYEQEVTYKLKRLTTLFEPAVIVMMGVMVGFVAVSVVSAMYGVFQETGQL